MPRKPAIIAFIVTTATLLIAAQLVAEPDEDRAKLLDLVNAQMNFEPNVADPAEDSDAIDLGKGVFAKLVPVEKAGVFAVDVVLDNRGDAPATAQLRVDCYAESFEGMGRVARPVSVLVAKKNVKDKLEPGQTLTRHLTFKPKKGQPAMSARLNVKHGKVTVKDAVFLAMAPEIPVGGQANRNANINAKSLVLSEVIF